MGLVNYTKMLCGGVYSSIDQKYQLIRTEDLTK